MAVGSPELTGVYDIAGLVDFCMGDIEFAEELLERFHTRLGTVTRSLEDCVRQGDLPAATSMVHSLKGEAGTLSARRLQDAAASLENALRSPELPGVTNLVEELQTAIDQCLGAHLAARSALQSIA